MPTSARFHGRNARLYVALAAGGSASQVAYLDKIDMQNSTDKPEVTAFGDANKTYVAGLPDDKGSFSGAADIAGADLYTAARDGIARKTYIYPDITNAPGTYWFTTAFFDFSTSLAVSDAGKISGNWVAASDVIRVVA